MMPSTTRSGAVTATCALILLTACSTTDGSASEEETFGPVPGYLLITVDVGDVSISPADVDEITVIRRVEGSGLTGSPSAEWEFDRDSLDLSVSCGIVLADCRAAYDIVVPQEVAVSLDTENVETQAHGFTEALSVTTTSGSVTIQGAAGPLSLAAENGDLTVQEGTSPTFEARVDNGSIDAAFNEAPSDASVTTGNGAAVLALPEAGYDVTANSDNGDVIIEVAEDPESGHAIDAQTDNGEILLVSSH